MVLNMKGNFQIKSLYRLKIHFWQNAKPNKKESTTHNKCQSFELAFSTITRAYPHLALHQINIQAIRIIDL